MDNVKENLKNIQNRCVGVLNVIDTLCRKYDIKYSINAGSVIGYHLYGGFIPWDDDVDIMMTRENYDKFLVIAEKELPEGFAVYNFENKRSRVNLISKVIDENTTVVEKYAFGGIKVEGVFVDITVYDKIPRNKMKRKYFIFLSKLVQCCRERNYNWDMKNLSFSENLKIFARNIGQFLLKPFNDHIYEYVKNTYKNVKTESYDYAEMMFGFNGVLDSNILSEYIDIEFHGTKTMMVKDYMGYLEARYGRREFYKSPKDDDVPHHLIYVDLNKPYKEYIAEQGEK